jgi:glucan biosynthesis protein C
MDYLRGGITVLVVAHHSALAYNTFSSFNPINYSWSTAPIVDPHRWAPLDYFVAWNDIYFMALMFFVSGLFVAPSLRRKGEGRFLADRAQRLGLPFAIAVTLLMPIAYYPSWLMSNRAGQSGYLQRFFTTDGWPVGPPWFLWVLLAFCAVVAFGHWVAPRLWRKPPLQPQSARSLAFIFLATSLMAIVPIRLFIAPYSWSSLGGPFDFQTSRVLLYFAYFCLGMVLGGENLSHSLSVRNLRVWPLWLLLALLSFLAHWILSGGAVMKGFSPWVANAVLAIDFAACCAFTILAALGVCRTFIRRSWKLADHLSANAYGIYILHYGLVIWLQFLLVSRAMPAPVKFAITFSGALAASWIATAALRRTLIRKVL